MYIAMNRFRIAPGREKDFIAVWQNRDSHLERVPGFIEFHLLQGETDSVGTLFASHSIWQSAEAFGNWTRSDAFRQAHARAGDTRGIYLESPQFEGFNVVL